MDERFVTLIDAEVVCAERHNIWHFVISQYRVVFGIPALRNAPIIRCDVERQRSDSPDIAAAVVTDIFSKRNQPLAVSHNVSLRGWRYKNARNERLISLEIW